MGFGYGEKTNWNDQYFEKGIVLPSTSNDTCENPLPVGKHHGALTVRATVSSSNASIPAGSSVTFTPLFCATSDGTFAAPSPAYAVSVSAPAEAAETVSSGEELCTFLLPDSDKEYCKIKIATSGAATGSLDVAMGYTAR